MTSTTTTAYYHHHSPSSSSSTSSSITRNHHHCSTTSKYNNFSSGASPTANNYLHHMSTTSGSSSPSSSSYLYKNRNLYDLNNSYRPSSYLSSFSSSSTTSLPYSTYASNVTSFSPKSSYTNSSYLSKYSSTSGPVTLTRFKHRRSSFDDSSDSSGPNNNKSESKIPVAGLINLGNTCYMNSVLQALYSTKPLRDFIINGLETGQLYSALSKLFKEMSSSIRIGYANPSIFRDAFIRIEPKFRGYEQQDAQEFLSYLTNDLHEEQNKAKLRSRGIVLEPKSAMEAWNLYRDRFNDSKLVDLFVGQFSSVIKCIHCGNESTCWDPFWDISLPVPRSRVDIEECLAAFTEAEILDGNEQPFCSKCKQHRKSTKRLSIVLSPKILVIHLKKFSNDGYKLSNDIAVNQQIKIDQNNNDQNNNHCNNNNNLTNMNNNESNHHHRHHQYDHHHHSSNFPNSIHHHQQNENHQNNWPKATKYELYACVCHHGFSSKSGHYTAYCQYDSKWYHYNDEKVKEVTDTFSMSMLKDAYVLFYRIQQPHQQDWSSSFSSSSTTYFSSKYYSSKL